ncbi:MAG: ArsR/SmtB family transcription factor [Candidatus Aminicenantia bacterium]
MRMEIYISEYFKPISNPLRLKIIELLMKGPLCVCDIWNSLMEEQSNISKHLNELKKAGILDSKRDKARIFYCIKNPQIIEIINAAKEFVKKTFEEKARIIEIKEKEGSI